LLLHTIVVCELSQTLTVAAVTAIFCLSMFRVLWGMTWCLLY